jgi:hypothetical protein
MITATPGPWLDLIPAAIPPELRVQPFVLWRAQPHPTGGKAIKVPYQIADPGRKASSTDPATWGSFADAVDAYGLLREPSRVDATRGRLAGIAVILSHAANLTCLDFDHMLAGDVLDPRVQILVDVFATWTEISPSGMGLHVFGRGHLPHALDDDPQFQAWSDRRMICLTGHRWPGTPATLHHIQPLLDEMVALDTPTPAPRAWTGPVAPPPDDLGGALLSRVATLRLDVVGPLKRWRDGYLVELAQCPWAAEHTSGPGGAAVLIHASGAFDFTCLHAHCRRRGWRELRTRLELA